jgi:hypothetical protein
LRKCLILAYPLSLYVDVTKYEDKREDTEQGAVEKVCIPLFLIPPEKIRKLAKQV